MTYRQLLARNTDFRRLWAGQVISEIGDWLNNIAVLALAIQLAGPRREGLAIAIYAIARHLPLFLFGPLAGVVVDRVSRKRVMVVADILRAILALGFILANVFKSLPIIYAVGASLFSVSSFFNAAKRASIPNLVHGTEELLSANSLSASTTAATIALGSALGGIVATFAGRNPVFILNAATFFASAFMIARIRRSTGGGASFEVESRTPIERRRTSSRHRTIVRDASYVLRRTASDFRDGLAYVRRTTLLSAIFIVGAGWGLGNGVARALYSIFGARLGILSASGLVARPTDFGISVLFVAMGLGGVFGAPIARRFNAGAGRTLGSRIGQSMTLDGIGLVVFTFMPTLWTAAPVLIAREINFSIWWTAQQTLMMTTIDDRYSGRVFATFETVTTLMMVFSMLAAGAAADTYGIRPVAATGGAIIALSGLLWLILRKRSTRLELAS